MGRLTIFSGIPTSIGGIFLTADATLASPEPSESSPARQLHALPTTRDDSIPGSQPNPPLANQLERLFLVAGRSPRQFVVRFQALLHMPQNPGNQSTVIA
jgi:hypothetical protein